MFKVLGPNPDRVEVIVSQGLKQQQSLGSYSKSAHIILIFPSFSKSKYDTHFCIIPSCWLITGNFFLTFQELRGKIIN